MPSLYPPLWCDFNACGWSGKPDDTCYYALDRKRLVELGSKAGDKVFLYMDDTADGSEVCGVEGELFEYHAGLIARPLSDQFYNGPRFW